DLDAVAGAAALAQQMVEQRAIAAAQVEHVRTLGHQTGDDAADRFVAHGTSLRAARCGIRAWERPGALTGVPSALTRCGIRAWERPGALIRHPSALTRCGIRAWERPGALIRYPSALTRCGIRAWERPGALIRYPSAL